MLCCFKDNNVSTISSSSPTLAGEKSGRNLGKKRSAKQIVPFEVGVATDANLAQMSNRSIWHIVVKLQKKQSHILWLCYFMETNIFSARLLVCGVY